MAKELFKRAMKELKKTKKKTTNRMEVFLQLHN